MRLIDVENGDFVRITGFEGGSGVEHKFRQLGLVPGDIVCIVRQAPLGGPLMVDIEGRVFAIGRGIASKITVEEYECDSP
jgi:ferrous iron transport protein A